MKTSALLHRLWCLTTYSVLLTAGSGCAHVPLDAHYRGARPLPPDVADYYTVPGEPPAAEAEWIEERGAYRRGLVRFPLRAADFEPTEPAVEIEWFESRRPGRRPALLFSPILGGDYPLERGLCRFFAARGFHVALVHRKTLKISPEHGAERIELLLRQSIVRNRQIVDWMSRYPRVDADRLGGFGISMGGMADVITAAVDPRLKAHVVVLAGGSLADILRDSRDRLITKPRARYLAAHSMDLETMHRVLSDEIRTDPLRFAPYVDARRLLMFIALNDPTIGRANALRLWRAVGKPQAIFVPVGHYTSYLYVPYLKYASLRFLRAHLR